MFPLFSSSESLDQPYAHCRRADPDGQGLCFAMTRADARVEDKVRRDSANAAQGFLGSKDQQTGCEWAIDSAVEDTVGICHSESGLT